MENKVVLSRKNRRILLWIYGMALLYFVLKQVYFAVVVEGFPDQIAQLSYVANMARFPSLVPDFASMPYYHGAVKVGAATVLKPYASQINYLLHPSPYYLLMALIGDVHPLEDGLVSLNVMLLRTWNIVLSASALALAFYLGFTRLKKQPPLIHALYAFGIATLPMLSYIGASVNSDNLAFLALVVFFAGLLRYKEGREDLKTYLLIGVGFLVGSMSKLTTALICALILFAVLVMSIIRTKSLKLILNRNFLITLPCYLLFLAYELIVRKRFGAWQPSLYNIDPEYFYRTIFYVKPENRIPMNLYQYFRHFVGGVGYTWSSLYSHNREVTAIMNNYHWGLIYWVPVGLMFFAALRQCVRRTFDRLTLPVAFSFAGTLAYHFYSNWKGYPVSGYLGGVQARYYLPMIIPIVYIMCDQIPPLFERRKKLGAVLGVLLLLGWLAGDALRLLFLYGFPD